MNKRIICLLVFSFSIVFCNSSQAVELYETGNINIHGFISQGYIQSGGNNFFADTKKHGTLQYSEAAVNFTSDVSDRLSLGIQLFSRDLGKMGNHELTVDWAFADYSFYDWLNLKAGKIKLPLGLYNTERDVDMLRTFVFLPQSMYYEGWRDSSNALNGAGLYGYIDAGLVGSFSYEGCLGNSPVSSTAGVARLLADQTPPSMDLKFSEINVQYTNAATLTWESIFGLEGLRIVGSFWAIEFEAESDFRTGGVILPDIGTPATVGVAYTRAQSTFDVRNVTGALSLEYVYENLVIAGEVMQNDYTLELEGVTPKSEFKSLGWYASLTYRFTDWLELGTYYNEYYTDEDDKDGKKAEALYYSLGPGNEGLAGGTSQAHQNYLKEICLTARFDITPNWILKVEGHQMEGAALLYSDDGNYADDGSIYYEKDWYYGAMKLTYSF